MRRIIPLLFLLLLSQLSIAQVKVQNLTTDNQTNPLAIESLTPLLSWQLLSDERGQRQTAYQVLVASSKDRLTESSDMWNSGKVQSNQSLYVPYKGKTLVSIQQYYWEVRVWDVNDKPSEYSTVNTWEMGKAYDRCNIGDFIQFGKVLNLWTAAPIETILNEDKNLLPSGLIGPVKLIRIKKQYVVF